MADAKIRYEATTARLPLGSFERMKATSMKHESMTAYIRETLLVEIARREKLIAAGLPLQYEYARAEALARPRKEVTQQSLDVA